MIGILNAWIGHRPEAERRQGRGFLWAGVAAGVVGAVALAAALVTVGEELSDDAQVYFQTTIVLIASALIVQMVFWMRRHGRTLKRELHAKLDNAADRSNWVAVFVARRDRGDAGRQRSGGVPLRHDGELRGLAPALGRRGGPWPRARDRHLRPPAGRGARRLVARLLPRHRDHAPAARRLASADGRRQSRFARRVAATFRPDMGHFAHSDGRGRARRPGLGPDRLPRQARSHSDSRARGATGS